MKKFKNAFIAMGVLILAAAIFLSVSDIIRRNQNQSATPTPGSTTEVIMSYDYNDVVGLVTKGQESFEFEKDGSGVWVCKSPAYITASDSAISNTVSMMASLQGQKVYQAGEYKGDLKDFGLGAPWLFTVRLKDGTEKTLRCGDATPTGTGYYVMTSENSPIYVVGTSYGTRLRLRQTTVTEGALVNFADQSLVNSVTIMADGKELLTMEAELMASTDGSISREWTVISPINVPGNSPEADALVKAVDEISIADTAESAAADLSKYGLDTPKREFIFKDYNGREYKLAVGSKTEDGLYYYCTAGAYKDVQRVYVSSLKFMDNTLLSYAYAYAFFENYIGLKSIKIELMGDLNEEHLLEFSFSEDSERLFFDGVEAEGKDRIYETKGITTYCYALQLDGVEPEEPAEKGRQLCRITYARLDGTEAVVEAFELDDARCALYRDGRYFGGWCETWRITREVDHQGLAGTIHAYLKGEIVD